MRVLGAADVRKALPMPAAIEAMRHAFKCLADGHALVPPRIHMNIKRHDGVSLIMPAYLDDGLTEAMALKVVSLFPGNAARNLPRIQAAVLVFESHTGRCLAMLEGAALTAIRTAAACGLATEYLARPDARTVAIFGAGVQARTQLQAVCCVRKIKTAYIYDPVPGKAEAMIAELADRRDVCGDLRPAADATEAIAHADIICTASTATRPVFENDDLRRGVHINAIGSYQPHVREIPDETIVRARVFVDSRQACLEETGDLIQPIQAGLIDESHIQAELGELVLGTKRGRTGRRQITLFKSVGVAAQDAAAGRAAYVAAMHQDLGAVVPW